MCFIQVFDESDDDQDIFHQQVLLFYKLFTGQYFMIHITSVLIKLILIITRIYLQYDTCIRQDLNRYKYSFEKLACCRFVYYNHNIIWFHLFEP